MRALGAFVAGLARPRRTLIIGLAACVAMLCKDSDRAERAIKVLAMLLGTTVPTPEPAPSESAALPPSG